MRQAATATKALPLAGVGGWRQVLDFGPFDWSKVDWRRAGRVAFGVVVPFGAGVASGHLEYGAFASLGALPAGFVSFQGSSRSRLTAVGLASAGMALSTFIGSVAAAYAMWSLLPVVLVLAYGCGLCVALDQRLSVAALQVAVALEVAVAVPLAPGPAGVRAALVLAGGLFQGLLIMVTWVLSPGAAERRALAASYGTLAGYARSLAAGNLGPPDPAAFPARRYMEDPNPLLWPAQRSMFVDLLEEAERIRASLAALSRFVGQGQAAAELCTLFTQSAAELAAVAGALNASRRRRRPAADRLFVRSQDVCLPEGAPWRWLGEALLGQLRAVSRMVTQLQGGRLSVQGLVPARHRSGHDPRAGDLGTLRANMTTGSEAGRHALRMAVAALVTEVIALASGLPEGRWAVLTLFIVLKPDYAGTVYRGVQRALGTALGAGLGIAIVELGHLGPIELMVVAGLAVGAAYAIFNVSYLVYSVWLTAFVVLLLDILGTPAVSVAGERLANTAIGSAIALLAFALWPTWEGRTANEKFARLLGAHAQYLDALFGYAAGRPVMGVGELRRLQLTARRARSDAEASAERLSHEPDQAGRLTSEAAAAVTAAVRRLANAELVLHASADPGPGPVTAVTAGSTAELRTAVDALNQAVQDALAQLAASLRRRERLADLPDLRPLYKALAAAAGGDDGTAAGDGTAALVTAADGVIDVVGTIASILRGTEWVGAPGLFPSAPATATRGRRG